MDVYLDIEATSLHADIGTLVLVGLIYDDREKFFFVESPSKEKEVLEEVVKFFESLKGEKFYIWNESYDIRFLITRCLKNGIDASIFLKLKVIDLLKFCRENLRLSSNSLENVSLFFGLEKNLKLKGKNILSLYQEYLEGKKENKEKIIEHCRDDLLKLKEVHAILKNLVEEWEKKLS